MSRVFFLFTILAASVSFSQVENDYAVTETQKALRDPKAREKIFTQDTGAGIAHKNAQTLTNGNAQLDQEMWELAAELVPLLAEKGSSDPAQMAQYLEEMRRNPASFIEQFKGPQREKLKNLADKIQKASQNKKP